MLNIYLEHSELENLCKRNLQIQLKNIKTDSNSV